MFKRLSIFVVLCLTFTFSYADLGYDDDGGIGFAATAAESVETNTTNFNGSLSGADDEVQKALDTLDDAIPGLLASSNTWTGKNTFTGEVEIDKNLKVDNLTVETTTHHLGPVDMDKNLLVDNLTVETTSHLLKDLTVDTTIFTDVLDANEVAVSTIRSKSPLIASLNGTLSSVAFQPNCLPVTRAINSSFSYVCSSLKSILSVGKTKVLARFLII